MTFMHSCVSKTTTVYLLCISLSLFGVCRGEAEGNHHVTSQCNDVMLSSPDKLLLYNQCLTLFFFLGGNAWSLSVSLHSRVLLSSSPQLSQLSKLITDKHSDSVVYKTVQPSYPDIGTARKHAVCACSPGIKRAFIQPSRGDFKFRFLNRSSSRLPA